jgi:hypothetical protein
LSPYYSDMFFFIGSFDTPLLCNQQLNYFLKILCLHSTIGSKISYQCFFNLLQYCGTWRWTGGSRSQGHHGNSNSKIYRGNDSRCVCMGELIIACETMIYSSSGTPKIIDRRTEKTERSWPSD